MHEKQAQFEEKRERVSNKERGIIKEKAYENEYLDRDRESERFKDRLRK